MALTKKDLIESVQNRTNFSKKKSSEIVESVIALICDSLANGEDVMISKFGKLQIKARKARTGRNPATGEPMHLPERKAVTFKLSDSLREKINDR